MAGQLRDRTFLMSRRMPMSGGVLGYVEPPMSVALGDTRQSVCFRHHGRALPDRPVSVFSGTRPRTIRRRNLPVTTMFLQDTRRNTLVGVPEGRIVFKAEGCRVLELGMWGQWFATVAQRGKHWTRGMACAFAHTRAPRGLPHSQLEPPTYMRWDPNQTWRWEEREREPDVSKPARWVSLTQRPQRQQIY